MFFCRGHMLRLNATMFLSILFSLNCATTEEKGSAPTENQQGADVDSTQDEETQENGNSQTQKTDEEALPETIVTCLAGTSTVILEDGRVVGKSQVLIRKTFMPAQGKILEHVVTIDGRPDHPPQEFMVELTVSGSSFKISERKGAFTGEGEFLAGAPWQWTAWKSKSILPDGSSVVSEDKYEASGLFIANKILHAPDGTPTIRLKEELQNISEQDFQTRRSQAMQDASD
jgi:hypothetical protein